MNTPTIHVLDHSFHGVPQSIASFLIETSEGPILVESGPHSSFENLQKAIQSHGYQVSDVTDLFLTHIHFDHAGAAWKFAEQGAQIHVHPFGVRHLASPEKLYLSAKRIYGDRMESLWGLMKPIDTSQLCACEHKSTVQFQNVEMTALHTPGHAKHHIAWQCGDVIFAGDVAGVKIGNGPVQPPCPPPDIDLEAWYRSIELLKQTPSKRLYLTHYGSVTDKIAHLQALADSLDDWSVWIRDRMYDVSIDVLTEAFIRYTGDQLKARGLNAAAITQYEAANPSWMSVAGLIRYWEGHKS